MIKTKLITLASLVLLLMPAAPALAEHGADDSSSNTAIAETETEHGTTTNKTSDDRKTQLAAKLDEVKLKTCQAREHGINTKLKRMAARGQKQLEVFTNIATRVEAFKTKNNLNVANYDTLVAAVNSQKEAAVAAVDKVNADSANFSCTSTDPKGVLQAFQADVKAENTALFNYRQAVKNLLVAVKTASGTTDSDKETQ
jgi:hypothetical protein